MKFFPKVVLTLPRSGLAILDVVSWAMVVAGHAHYTVAQPYGFPLWHFDVFHGTDILASSAGSTFVIYTILAVVGGKTVEARIYHVRFEPSQTAHNHL